MPIQQTLDSPASPIEQTLDSPASPSCRLDILSGCLPSSPVINYKKSSDTECRLNLLIVVWKPKFWIQCVTHNPFPHLKFFKDDLPDYFSFTFTNYFGVVVFALIFSLSELCAAFSLLLGWKWVGSKKEWERAVVWRNIFSLSSVHSIDFTDFLLCYNCVFPTSCLLFRDFFIANIYYYGSQFLSKLLYQFLTIFHTTKSFDD